VSAEDPRFPRPRRPPRSEAPRRRQRTRRLLIAVVLGLAIVLAGAEALLRAKPTVEVDGLRVEAPPLALAEVRTCNRGTDEETVDEVLAEFTPGGRVSSAQVYACPAAFDGLRVTFVGEAIGEVLPRRGGAWLQVNDDDYALEVGPLGPHVERRGFSGGISVWLPDGLHERIEGVGRHERHHPAGGQPADPGPHGGDPRTFPPRPGHRRWAARHAGAGGSGLVAAGEAALNAVAVSVLLRLLSPRLATGRATHAGPSVGG
jgi:hypothetical protein